MRKYQTCFEKPMEQYLNELGYYRGIDFSFDFDLRSKYGYRIDFAFPEIKLGIECDGENYHKLNNEHDRKRDCYLRGRGWFILRFRGEEIVSNFIYVKEKIKENIEKLKEENDVKSISKN